MWWIITNISMPIAIAVQKDTPMSQESATALPLDTNKPMIVSTIPAIPTPRNLLAQAQDDGVSEGIAAEAVAAWVLI
jgi:hypothetical protein